MRYVDTNVLIRLITRDDPALARRAETYISNAPTGDIVVLDAVIDETCTVLEFNQAYRLPRQLIYQALSRLLNRSVFEVSATARQALTVYAKHSKLDFVDCLLYVAAKGHNQSVISFDKDLLKILK